MTAHGIRLNNPGNIRLSSTKWIGTPADQPDHDFITFTSPEFGIRAMCRILLTYNGRGLNTVRQIISTWAPPSENNTDAYITDVAARCEVGPDDELDVDSVTCMKPLLQAIIQHENGEMPYSDAVINDAMRLAGVSDAKPKPIMANRAIQGSAIATAGTTIAAATEVARQVQDVQAVAKTGIDTLHWLLSYGPWMALALVTIGLIGVVYSKMSERKRLGH